MSELGVNDCVVCCQGSFVPDQAKNIITKWTKKHGQGSDQGQAHLFCLFNIGGAVPWDKQIKASEYKNVLILMKMNVNQSWIYFKTP